MGIKNLLVELKDITRRRHISEYSGQTIAIDSYCWLHHAVIRSCGEIALGIPTDQWIKQFIARVSILLSNGITPIMVWDGRKLPAKGNVESSRAQRRVREMELALEKLEKRQKTEAIKHFQSTVDVTPEMAARCIKVLRSMNIECVVAPYEADAQLAHLSLNGRASMVITEDSDLLVFGCKKVLYKLKADGWGEEITLNDVLDSPRSPFYGLTFAQFRQTCILAGCDYLDSVKGVGLLTAIKHMRKELCIHRVCRALRLQGLSVPADYEVGSSWAELVFLYQRVCSPIVEESKVNHEYNLTNKVFELCHVTVKALPSTLARWSERVCKASDINGELFCPKSYSMAQCKYCAVTLSDSIRSKYTETNYSDTYPMFNAVRSHQNNFVDHYSSRVQQKTKSDLVKEITCLATCLDSRIGYPIPSSVVTGVAMGLLDPDSFIPFQCALDGSEDDNVMLKAEIDEINLKVNISDSLLGVEEGSDSHSPGVEENSGSLEDIEHKKSTSSPVTRCSSEPIADKEERFDVGNFSPTLREVTGMSQLLMGCGQDGFDNDETDSDDLEIVGCKIPSVVGSSSPSSSSCSAPSISLEGKEDIEVISSNVFVSRSQTLILEETETVSVVYGNLEVNELAPLKYIGSGSLSTLGVVHLALSEISWLVLMSKDAESSRGIKDILAFLLSHISHCNHPVSDELDGLRLTIDYIRSVVSAVFQAEPVQSHVAGIVLAGIIGQSDCDRLIAYQDLWNLRKNALFRPSLNKAGVNPVFSIFQKSALASKSNQTVQKAQNTNETYVIQKRDVRGSTVQSLAIPDVGCSTLKEEPCLKEQALTVQSYKNPIKFKRRSTSLYKERQSSATAVVSRTSSTPEQRHLATVFDKRDHLINVNSPAHITSASPGIPMSSEQQMKANPSPYGQFSNGHDENIDLSVARSQTTWLDKNGTPISQLDLLGTPSFNVDGNVTPNDAIAKANASANGCVHTEDASKVKTADQTVRYRLMSSTNGIRCQKISTSHVSTVQPTTIASGTRNFEQIITQTTQVETKVVYEESSPKVPSNLSIANNSFAEPGKRSQSNVLLLGSGVSHKQLRQL